jgi:serine/threonine protein kinase HipA of HipAB toxin-antitoxin module
MQLLLSLMDWSFALLRRRSSMSATRRTEGTRGKAFEHECNVENRRDARKGNGKKVSLMEFEETLKAETNDLAFDLGKRVVTEGYL